MRKEVFAKLFGISRASAFNYLNNPQERPIVQIVEKYLSEKDVEEFEQTGKISRFEITSPTLAIRELLLTISISPAMIKLFALFAAEHRRVRNHANTTFTAGHFLFFVAKKLDIFSEDLRLQKNAFDFAQQICSAHEKAILLLDMQQHNDFMGLFNSELKDFKPFKTFLFFYFYPHEDQEDEARMNFEEIYRKKNKIQRKH